MKHKNNKKIVFENKYYKTINLIIYLTLILFLNIIYFSLTLLDTRIAKIITIIFSFIISILIIFYRETIIRNINDIIINYRIKRIRKKNKNNLKKILNELNFKHKIERDLFKKEESTKYELKHNSEKYIEIK